MNDYNKTLLDIVTEACINEGFALAIEDIPNVAQVVLELINDEIVESVWRADIPITYREGDY